VQKNYPLAPPIQRIKRVSPGPLLPVIAKAALCVPKLSAFGRNLCLDLVWSIAFVLSVVILQFLEEHL
jgi:hypothetical protein